MSDHQKLNNFLIFAADVLISERTDHHYSYYLHSAVQAKKNEIFSICKCFFCPKAHKLARTNVKASICLVRDILLLTVEQVFSSLLDVCFYLALKAGQLGTIRDKKGQTGTKGTNRDKQGQISLCH